MHVAFADWSVGDFLGAIHDLTPAILEQRQEIERQRRLPVALVESMRYAGLFSLWLPRALGGPQLSVADFIRTVEAISRADGAAGWCAMIHASSSLIAGYLTEPVAREIYGDGAVMAGAVGPTGRAVAVSGGYRVTGRWAFASGIENSDWILGNCLVFDGDVRRNSPEGGPVVRMMILPKHEVEIIDTWHVSGLRGTGSHDFRVADAFVPEERSMGGFGDTPTQPGTLFACPLITIFGAALAAVPLGIARTAIDELISLAQSKTATGSTSLLRDKPTIQTEVGRADALLRSARGLLFDSVRELWDEAEAGPVSLEKRGAVRLACAQVGVVCKEVCARMFDAGGGSALYEDARLERCLRDVQAAGQHITLSATGFELGGRVLLGLEPGTPRF